MVKSYIEERQHYMQNTVIIQNQMNPTARPDDHATSYTEKKTEQVCGLHQDKNLQSG